MQITRDLFEAMVGLLITDVGLLYTAEDPAELHLINADFTPSLDLVIGDLSLKDTGLETEQISSALGGIDFGIDPVSGDALLRFVPGTLQFPFFETNGTVYPETIYGIALTSVDAGGLRGTIKFPEPIVVTRDGEFIEAIPAGFNFPASMVR